MTPKKIPIAELKSYSHDPAERTEMSTLLKQFKFTHITKKGYFKRRGEKNSYKFMRCVECGQLAIVRSDTHQDFCSVSCQSKNSWRVGKMSPIIRTRVVHGVCPQCGTEFTDYTSNKRVFCSNECFRAHFAAEKLKRVCKWCNKEFEMCKKTIENTNASGNYCCRDCYNESMRGENSKFYIDGRYRHTRLTTAIWQRIRRQVLAKFPVCSICGSDKTRSVHHIIPYRISQDDGLDNLVALCKRCHSKIERITQDCEAQCGVKCIDWSVLKYIIRSNIIQRQMIIAMISKEQTHEH